MRAAGCQTNQVWWTVLGSLNTPKTDLQSELAAVEDEGRKVEVTIDDSGKATNVFDEDRMHPCSVLVQRFGYLSVVPTT